MSQDNGPLSRRLNWSRGPSLRRRLNEALCKQTIVLEVESPFAVTILELPFVFPWAYPFICVTSTASKQIQCRQSVYFH